MRPTSLVLLCLSLFLVLFPLVLKTPGWPAGLKADGPAYFLMAMSLAHDGDLRCELGDLRRLVDEFPYHPAHNLILASDDGWHTVYFGKPYLYSLFAAPAARLFGANGMVAFNMALTMAMVWLGTCYLRRFNPAPAATLFAAGFFLLSVGFAYVFWVHPEVFNMAAITVCLYLGLTERTAGGIERGRSADCLSEASFEHRPQPDPAGHPARPGFRHRLLAVVTSPLVRALASGAALSLAVYHKPMLAAMGLPVVFAYFQGRRFKVLGAWLLGAVFSLALAVAVAVALTGHPTAYLGFARGGYKVCSPDVMPIQPLPVRPAPAPSPREAPAEETSPDDAPVRAWSWIIRLPPLRPAELARNTGFFFWGRHTGLLLYFPFAILTVILFLVHARRSGVRWMLLASLALVAAFFLLWIPFNWHGGGGFVGNRYFVNVYPGFLFLATRIAPAWIHVLGYALGGMLLGSTIFSPTGRAVPWPTLQAHVRNFPYPLFPLELTMREIPGYVERTIAGARLRGREDVFLPRGPRFWVHGATTTEVWIRSPEPLSELIFRVRSFAARNDVVLRLGGTEERLHFAPGDDPGRRRVTLEPGRPTRTLHLRGYPIAFYRLEVTCTTGEVREWTKHYPPRDCEYFPYVATHPEPFYVGAELSYLGTAARLATDLYAVEWGTCEAPPQVRAGETFTIGTEVWNRSAEPWPVDPPTRVNLSYHWEDGAGAEVVRNGVRTSPEKAVAPGTRLAMAQTVLAPATPGSYVLVLDLVFEEVSWFSVKNGGNVLRVPVEVVPSRTLSPGPAPRAPGDSPG